MYSYNPYYEKYLMHYGTKEHSGRYPYGSGERPYQRLGIKKVAKKIVAKGAAHKAIEYAKDINAHRRNQAVRDAKSSYERGEITKQEYKDAKFKANQDLKDADYKAIKDIIQLKAEVTEDSARKVNEIYSKYKETAYSEIPNYLAKRGIRTAAQLTSAVIAGFVVGGLVKDVKDIFKDINPINKELESLGLNKKDYWKNADVATSDGGYKYLNKITKTQRRKVISNTDYALNKAVIDYVLGTTVNYAVAPAVLLNAGATKLSRKLM